jgi:prepilin-type N-terminal cleavage/methylation domain-containing protein
MDARRTTMPSLDDYPRCGFTLVELAVCLGVVALLTSILLPAIQRARESARQVECKNNLRQIMIAIHNHESQHGFFPGIAVKGHAWRSRILPFLEQDMPALGKNGLVSGGPSALQVYACPSDSMSRGSLGPQEHSYYMSNGRGSGHSDGFYSTPLNTPLFARDVSDGLSNTVAVSERKAIPEVTGSMQSDFSNEFFWGGRIVRNISNADDDIDALATECEIHSTAPLLTVFLPSSYDHIQVPGRRSCRVVSGGEATSRHRVAITASSCHSLFLFTQGWVTARCEQLDIQSIPQFGGRWELCKVASHPQRLPIETLPPSLTYDNFHMPIYGIRSSTVFSSCLRFTVMETR